MLGELEGNGNRIENGMAKRREKLSKEISRAARWAFSALMPERLEKHANLRSLRNRRKEE